MFPNNKDVTVIDTQDDAPRAGFHLDILLDRTTQWGVIHKSIIAEDCKMSHMLFNVKTAVGAMWLPSTVLDFYRNGVLTITYDPRIEIDEGGVPQQKEPQIQLVNEGCSYFRTGDVLEIRMRDDFPAHTLEETYEIHFNTFDA